MDNMIDEQDLSKLLSAIVRQAMDDYIKLQHPKYRKKKYLTEAFHEAIDMFFDDTYLFGSIPNEDGFDMSFIDMLKTTLKTEHVDINKIRDHVIVEASSFWDTKVIKTVDIPSTLQVNGHVYNIEHTEDSGSYTVDYDEKILTLNRLPDSTNEETFVEAVFEIVLYHESIPMKTNHIDKLSKAWFRTLKLNNCFNGVD
jgi:hypothetical protein